MKKEILDENYKGEVIRHDVTKYVPEADYVVNVIRAHVFRIYSNGNVNFHLEQNYKTTRSIPV